LARAFDGTDDEVRCSIGGVSGFTFGTLAVIVRRGATAAWHSLIGLNNSSGLVQASLEFNDTDFLCWANQSVSPRTTTTFVSTTTWYCIIVTKATGTVSPRFHWYNYTTNAWTHQDPFSASTAANAGSLSGGTVRFGEWEDTDDFTGDIALGAAWSGVTFTDAQLEAMGLPFSLSNWHAAAPSGLWILDQSATGQKVVDLTGGGANESAIGGTSVSANSVPVFGYGDSPWFVIRPQPAAATFSIPPALIMQRWTNRTRLVYR
jgi:hypothetical protein